MNRREFLQRSAAGALGLALGGCNDRLLNAFNKGEEQLWGMNVHPNTGIMCDVQIQALRELGIRRVRTTLGLHRDYAGPYLRGFPAEYVGIVGDPDDPLPDAGVWPSLVRAAVSRWSGVTFFEVLNEPMQLSPRTYVQSYLRPAYDIIKTANPGYLVAAAAPTATSGGRVYFYQMTDAGADSWCDLRAVHLYSDNPEIYLAGTHRPFIVTESGIQDPARHVDWWARKMTHISGVLETDRVYWYVLMDQDTLWALISNTSRPGQIRVLSPLYGYIRGKWGK